jgi:dephospho-CoA kinase
MTRIIGVTGGIGSGKSTLTACFNFKGVPSIDADEIARFALTPESDCFGKAMTLFGNEALRPDGTADRAYIASRVFGDPSLRDALNGIIHPFVLDEMRKRSDSVDAPLVVWDVPLLFESGFDAFCACTVAVLCKEEIRVARVKRRDGSNEAQVRARIRAQISDETRASLATYTIRNEADVASFVTEATDLIDRIREELV